jgi:hypothetical protein
MKGRLKKSFQQRMKRQKKQYLCSPFFWGGMKGRRTDAKSSKQEMKQIKKKA